MKTVARHAAGAERPRLAAALQEFRDSPGGAGATPQDEIDLIALSERAGEEVTP